MKKKQTKLRVIALMILAILLLTACNKNMYNNIEEQRVQSTTYQIPISSTNSYSNQSDSTKSNSYAGVASGFHNVPKTYGLFEGQGTENDFIEWCKDSVDNYDADSEYTDNVNFLSYIRNNDRIIVPHMKNKDFFFQRATSIPDNLGCCYFIWYRDKDYNRFRFAMYPISELQDYTNLFSYFSNTESVDYEIDRGACKYGQYFVGIREDGSKKQCSVYFEVEGYVVKLWLDNMEWHKDYFDYFDFETVSLKD